MVTDNHEPQKQFPKQEREELIMNFLYISDTCSKKKYAEYVESKGQRVSQQAQKYNLLLAEGLASSGAKVRLLSTRPINRGVSRKLWFRGQRERVGGIDFRYLPFINYPILRNLCIFFGTFFRVLFAPFGRKDSAVICDALNIVATMAAQMASVLRSYKTVGIVTDVPCHLSNMQNITFSQKLNLFIMKRFHSYLLLTDSMSGIVNPKNRPYIVLEGHADANMENVENILSEKAPKKICLYAGSLMEIYGIGNLVEGFVAADIPNAELHVYGSGDYEEELQVLAAQHETVKYLGVVPNEEIIKAELAATLLVNPRPTNEEYTKYSFPSKNMEYMASGTPVLTTKLPGMPADHLPHVFLIEDETAEGIKNALLDVFSHTPEELHSFGAEAKKFVINEKNNCAQAKKVLDFCAALSQKSVPHN